MAGRKINQAGVDLICGFESCKLKSYLCPAGIWTIGWGHTGRDVLPAQRITEADADRLLLADLEKFCIAVQDMVMVDLKDNQFSALVSLCFNIGEFALSKSTLIRKLNAGDYAGAALEFPRWNKSNGKVLPGLVKRRAAEQRLFMGAGV